MRIHLGSTLMLALGLSWAVIGQSSSPMREGMWEVNSKLSFAGMGEGMPMKHQQCVTAAMIQDPQSAIPKMDNDCKVSNYKLAANVATYTLTCASPVEIVGNGEIRYAGPNAYTGTLILGAQGASYTLSYEAKRIGDCPK